MQNDKKNTSGTVRIQDNMIFWDYENESILQIDLDQVIVIGEYTNSDGPWFDDWFITFVTKDGNWQSIPWYADAQDKLANLLCQKFQPHLNVSYLTNSTTWNSVVRYPVYLEGRQLFKLIPSQDFKEPKTFFDKLLSSIGPGNFNTTKYLELTDEVKQELMNASR